MLSLESVKGGAQIPALFLRITTKKTEKHYYTYFFWYS